MSYNMVGRVRVHKYFHFYYKLEGFEGSKGKELKKVTYFFKKEKWPDLAQLL